MSLKLTISPHCELKTKRTFNQVVKCVYIKTIANEAYTEPIACGHKSFNSHSII